MKAHLKIYLLTLIAMIAFAANSLLCRWALKETATDAVSFTALRMLSGAIVLWIIYKSKNYLHSPSNQVTANWFSAFVLFIYAITFSYAYTNLPTGTGALLLFAAVQLTMIIYAFWQGECLNIQETLGLMAAAAGVIGLLLPHISAPHLTDSLLMLVAGIAWAIYSLRGKSATDAICVNAGNFMLASVFAVFLALALIYKLRIDTTGFLLAVTSGAITSAFGYVIWYTVIKKLSITNAAVVQLSVPIIAAIAGAVFLNDAITLRLVIASIATLGGIGLVLVSRTSYSKK